MKIKILIFVLFILNFVTINYIHGEEVMCPYCGSSDYVELVSTTATCTEDGDAAYRCTNISSPRHVVAAYAEFSGPMAALGHDMHDSIERKPTCIKEGKLVYECSRCDYSYSEDIDTIDHEYIKTIRKQATCLEDGIIDYKCSMCEDTYSQTIKAYGHNFKQTENIEATCTNDGYILNVCSRCKQEDKQILKATGHNATLQIKKQPTCTEQGLKSGICLNCGEELIETLPALGHDYPSEYTIDVEPSIFKEGKQSKTCKSCGEAIEEVVPKKQIPNAVYIAGGSLVASTGAILALVKKKTASKAAKKIGEEIVDKELLKPSFEDRTIVTCLKDDSFYRLLKIQKHLKVIESEYDSIFEAIEENEPDITLIDLSDSNIKKCAKKLSSIKKDLQAPLISILVSDNQIKKNKTELEKLKEEQIIKDYIDVNTNANVALVKLVLPIMKPDLKSDEALENIGMVADALNIPGVSTIIDTFITSREIKQTYEDGKQEGLSFVDKSVIISDIASILHLDTISSVSGLVSDLDDVKSSLQSKIGGNEISTTKDAISDIVDVVSEIVDN